MKEARHCYILSNGVAVVVGDKVKLVTTDKEEYVGDIIDVSTSGIWIKLPNDEGEVDVFFYELEDVQLVK